MLAHLVILATLYLNADAILSACRVRIPPLAGFTHGVLPNHWLPLYLFSHFAVFSAGGWTNTAYSAWGVCGPLGEPPARPGPGMVDLGVYGHFPQKIGEANRRLWMLSYQGRPLLLAAARRELVSRLRALHNAAHPHAAVDQVFLFEHRWPMSPDGFWAEHARCGSWPMSEPLPASASTPPQARGWRCFWSLSGPPHALALFRIALGLYLLVRWLALAPLVPTFLCGSGLWFPFVYPQDATPPAWWSVVAWLTRPPTEFQAWVLYGVTVAAIVCMTIGYRTRTATAVFLAGFVYHWLAYFHMANFSFERVAFVFGGLLLLSPAGAALSFDARHRPARTDCPLWTQRLICVQVALVYFGTGLFKVACPSWSRGDILASALMGDWTTDLAFAIARLDLPMGVFDLAVLAVVLLELSLGFLLFSVRWRVLAMALGTGFHLFNAVVLGIGEFLLVPLAYPLFLAPEAVRRWCSRRTGFLTAGSRRSRCRSRC